MAYSKKGQWTDKYTNTTYKVGDIVKVVDSEKEHDGLDENYVIVGIDEGEELAECMQLDDDGKPFGYYEFLCSWLLTPKMARESYPEHFGKAVDEETRSGINAFLTEYEKTVRENTCGNCHNRLTQEDAVDLLAKAVGLLREVVAE